MSKYEGDTTTCKNCSYIHYLKDKLIPFCKKCNYDMRIKLTPEQESNIIENLDSTYKKQRVDNLK